MRFPGRSIVLAGCVMGLAACADDAKAPTALVPPAPSNRWGPETPHFNLEVILRGDGFGHVSFRQPNDAELVIHLHTWVRGLEPNTSYVLQRAVDTNLDGICASTSWLTLGRGPDPQAIITDDRGTGEADLFRSVAAFPVGSSFDIHFRLMKVGAVEPALTSDCYRYTISQ